MDPADADSVRSAIAQQGAWLGRHTDQLTTTAREMEDLSARFNELSSRLDRTHHSRDSEPHAANPPPYDGDPASCRAFLSQCSLVFALQPRRYATERTRIAYVITLLVGRARQWGIAVWDAQDPCCHSFEEFREEMVKLFDRSARGDAAAARLARLTQGASSVTDFSIQFKTLATACSWNEAALRAQFLEGLCDNIQDEIATHDLSHTLDGIIELALRVEARMQFRDHRRTLRHRVHQSEVSQSSQSSVPLTSETEPMQLGRMRLSQRERERRLQNCLCLYCGKPGHFAKSCPVKGTAHR